MHMLDFAGEEAAMAYAGAGVPPWHGLGQKMEEGQPIEVWRSRAHLDWEIERRDLFYARPGETGMVAYGDRIALVRSDNNAALGIVSRRYKPHQPDEIVDFYRRLTNELGFKMDTLGALSNGKVIWALASTPVGFAIGDRNEDVLRRYLLLSTANDGTASTTCRWTDVRVVCMNTLRAAIGRNGLKTISLSHRSMFDGTALHRNLGLDRAAMEERASIFEAMASRKLTDNEAWTFFKEVCGLADEPGVRPRADNPVAQMRLAFARGPGSNLPTADGTLWGALNAVTYVQDHIAGRVRGRMRDSGLKSALFGAGETRKDQALEIASAMVGA